VAEEDPLSTRSRNERQCRDAAGLKESLPFSCAANMSPLTRKNGLQMAEEVVSQNEELANCNRQGNLHLADIKKSWTPCGIREE